MPPLGQPATSAPVNGGVSFWYRAIGLPDPRPPLDGTVDADVCIVGAGFTGLWTAYYLLKARPGLSVVLLEAQIAGFGASGRNGGWCSALFPASVRALERRHGLDAALAMRRAMNDTVTEIEKVAAAESIACDWVRGGTLYLARTAVQEARLRAEVDDDRSLSGVDGLRWLDGTAAR